ncbi:hypothetical protein Bbelb_309150 [Branchiostoma belcheri]|nr:hypothetical protein Bbelb_309150 [Branchiostoma belcheri]
MILPILDYCDMVWGSCGATKLQQLQILQNRAARVVLQRRLRDCSIDSGVGWRSGRSLDYETGRPGFDSGSYLDKSEHAPRRCTLGKDDALGGNADHFLLTNFIVDDDPDILLTRRS